MLILRRKKNESILIGDNIRVTITECASSGVRLAIEAPKQIPVVREELFEAEKMNKASLARLYEARNNMEFRIEKASGDTMTAEETEKLEALKGYKQKFIDAMDDDLNTADALSAIFELTREINAYNGSHQDATKAFLTAAHDLFMELTGVLNLVQNRDDAADPDAEKIEELIAQRAAAKKEKNFAEADRIRGVLADMGVTIKDTRQGTQWSRN